MTGRRAAPRSSSLALISLLLAVLALVLFSRPGGDADELDKPARAVQPSASTELPAPQAASEEAFCAEFRRLAAAQGEYAAVPDERAAELLREAADRMVATGVPETMTLPARGGYFTVMEGIYGSLGLALQPAAVGALDDPTEGADAAFSSYLVQYCPA